MTKITSLQAPFLDKKFKKVYHDINGVLRLYYLLIPVILLVVTILLAGPVAAQEKSLVVRLAKLRIDSTQLESYKAALKEGIETAVRVEPGVLTLYAVSEKDNPTHITVFEVYANEEAYKAHLESPHFKKYKNTTKEMIKSLELLETVPILLRAKGR